MRNRILAIVLFTFAMILFHYHSTLHFVWALVGISYKFPLDPIDGWWALLKGLLPPFSLFIVFFTGLITKIKNRKYGISS